MKRQNYLKNTHAEEGKISLPVSGFIFAAQLIQENFQLSL